ncbi:hypothetical protein ES705_43057 [subsurface metagenome]
MAELRCKSVRMDMTYTAADYDEIWSWAPDRNIKIKGISWTVDVPAENGTAWLWLSKGAVGMVSPTPGPNEEEMIISAIHSRSENAASPSPGNTFPTIMFGSDYMEVEEGEKLYVLGRGDTAKIVGFALCIYYI